MYFHCIMKLLLVEDEAELASSVLSYLKKENYLCEAVSTFDDALEKITGYNYDCILLDITLPDGNGLMLLNELKQQKKLDGVIIISAKNSIDDKIKGLSMGADDYLTKPFHLAELSARIAAIIRRKQFDGANRIATKDLVLDLSAKTLMVHNKEVDLTRKEFELLTFLVSNKNRVISKAAIAEHINGDNAEVLDNFDFIYAHIKNLKKKMTEAGGEDHIKTVYGLGYKFEI